MKKLLTALIAFVMCFSVVTTAFAATPDETSDSDLISDIKQAMLDTYYGDEKPEYLNVEILLDKDAIKLLRHGNTEKNNLPV